ncbi:MAG: EAL domain-containing protein [Clostridium sp.]|nr:MAG: EAL domain-containing protein [Clostridium sp.]
MIIKRNQLLIDIDRAIEQHEFLVYFQPQINSYDGRLVGAEALVRWLHPKYGMVSPGEFIPLFEEHMLISKIRQVCLGRVLYIFLNKWHGKYPNLLISINISVNDFFIIWMFVVFLVDLITKYEIAPKNLKIRDNGICLCKR